MAERRMFAKTIVLSDAFLDMSTGARLLYFTMGMVADDDGFVNSPKSIMRQIGASEDDLKILISKRYILPFVDGVIVIKHWRINNYLQGDRVKPTLYYEHRNSLTLDDKNSYIFKSESTKPQEETACIHDPVYTTLYTQDSIGKDSLGKDSIGKDNISTTTTTESAGAGAPTREDSTQLEETKPNEYEVAEFFRSEYCMTTKEAKCQAKAFMAYNNSRGWRFADWKEAADLWASRIREEE